MEEYEKECKKRQARAEKFGTTYVPPKLEDFLPWTEVKRLKSKASIAAGFATGIDLLDSEEIAKQEARKARFLATSKNSNNHSNNDNDNDNESEPANAATSAASDSERAESSIIVEPPSSPPPQDMMEETTIDLPVSQCWDKEEMLRPQRTDPPASLWINPNVDESTTGTMTEEQPTWVREKIHLFAIDWAAFKQIRNKDLMAFFTGYGPTYVEWLGDLSCNVCFGDQYTAKRALMTLGQEIPSPPPEAELSEQQEEAVDKEENKQSDGVVTSSRTTPDLGNMHWRFCRQPVRKIANDKYGRKGTIARVLMRFALSTDILHDRPNSWPAPPGGFSSTKVLGPESDFKAPKKSSRSKRQREKKKSALKDSQQDQQQQQNIASSTGEETGEHPLLTRGLSAGRAGFSVEEMEEERAKKRSKTSETTTTNGNNDS